MSILYYSTPPSHITTAAPLTTTNNSILASKFSHKTYLYFSKKPSSTSLIVKCKKGQAPSTEPVEELIYDLNDLGLSPTLLPTSNVKREEFPRDFLFGASTSAIQTEGRWDEGGRGKSVWDQILEGGDAVDSYHLYYQDVKLLKDMGMNAYRFSISWSRILPNGTIDGGINEEGIRFYNKLINELQAHRIQPIVTLMHFDLPQALQDKYKGILSPQFIEDFKEYADFCFKTFGDRVKIWGTINEPMIFIYLGIKLGYPPELENDPLAPYIAYHNIILAHSAAAKHYQHKYKESQGGKIGISLPIEWQMPYDSNDPTDLAAVEATLDLQIGWFMNPLVHGDYPDWMKKNVKGLPKFSKNDKEMVKGAFDYIGINYYTSRFIENKFEYDVFGDKVSLTYESHTNDVHGNKLGIPAKGRDDIYDYPEGLRQLLLHMKNKYDNPELYVTENGISTMPDVKDSIRNLIHQGKRQEVEDALYDDTTIHYVMGHIKAVHDAWREGVKVKGYVVWSLLDNVEMGTEKPYDVRFGLNFVDYFDNHRRFHKKSAIWFSRFLNIHPSLKN